LQNPLSRDGHSRQEKRITHERVSRFAQFQAALLLDSGVVDLRMVYTDAVPFHDL